MAMLSITVSISNLLDHMKEKNIRPVHRRLSGSCDQIPIGFVVADVASPCPYITQCLVSSQSNRSRSVETHARTGHSSTLFDYVRFHNTGSIGTGREWQSWMPAPHVSGTSSIFRTSEPSTPPFYLPRRAVLGKHDSRFDLRS
jgi:hypothetical protein